MKFYIMNFDTEIASFETRTSNLGETKVFNERYSVKDTNLLLGTDLKKWIYSRNPFNKRAEIDKLLAILGIRNIEKYFTVTYGLSLNDALWVKPEEQRRLKWSSVNLYNNPFNEQIARFAFEGNGSVKNSTSPEFDTDGTLPKCWKRVNGNIYLYKGGSTGARNSGREPFSEAYATQLLQVLGIEQSFYVPYDCIKYHGKYASRCKLFTSENIGFRSQSKVFYVDSFEDLLNWQLNSKFSDAFRLMYVFDALILNEDRHLGNYGYLIDNKTGNITGVAPLFDNGLGFLSYFFSNETGVSLTREFDNYMDTRLMSSGADFVAVARYCLTSELRSCLLNLNGFKFKPISWDYENRAMFLDRMLSRQIQKLIV